MFVCLRLFLICSWYSSSLCSLHCSSTNLPTSPLDSPEHLLKFSSKNPWNWDNYNKYSPSIIAFSRASRGRIWVSRCLYIYIYTVWHEESDVQVKFHQIHHLDGQIRKFKFFRPIFQTDYCLMLPNNDFNILYVRKSYFWPSRCWERSILTWTSDSSCQTVYIDSWKGQKSANWVVFGGNLFFNMFIF